MRGQIVLISRKQGPGGSRRLIGERDNRPIEAPPRREPFQPQGTTILALRQSKHHRAGAMNHLASEIVIGAPSNPAEPRFAAGRILTRHEANPRRKFSPRAEMATVVHRGDKRRCDHRTDAWQLRRAADRLRSSGKELMSCRSSLSSRRSRARSSSSMSAEELTREIGKVAAAIASCACARKRHAPWGKMTPYSPRSPRI